MASPAKRSFSPTAETSAASRRKKNTSDETTASTATDLSTNTRATTPGHIGESSIMDAKSHYEGLRGNLRLLARGNKPLRSRPMVDDQYGNPGLVPAPKKAFTIFDEKISGILKQGLRSSLVTILESMQPSKWFTMDIVRLGYEEDEKENPVVILVTIESDTVAEDEAHRVAREMELACRNVELGEIEVEMVHGERSKFLSLLDEKETLPLPTEIPLVGASIATARKHQEIATGCGTLGGYVLVGGIVYAMTCHHVCFGTSSMAAYSPHDGKIEIKQPAELDLEDAITELKQQLEYVEVMAGVSTFEQATKEARKKLHEMEAWMTKETTIGSVYRSSGIRACEGIEGTRHRMDWALIRLEDMSRISNPQDIKNQIPRYMLRQTSQNRYLKQAGSILGRELRMLDLPTHVKQPLDIEQVQKLQNLAEEEDKKYGVWKCGRSTHHTFGILSGIHSNYKSSQGLVSDELMVMDKTTDGNDIFSRGGDSGSFVWDTDGNLIGMLWGGRQESFVTYVTPMTALLKDIQRVCGTNDVEIVGRAENVNTVGFTNME